MLARVHLYLHFIFSSLQIFFLSRTKWKRQTAVGLELLAEAGNYAAVQRMLQTSPYWLSQYGNVATAALAAAAATNPTLSGPGGNTGTTGAAGSATPTATPFDIYYRQAAAALQQKHQNTPPVTTTTGIPGSPPTPTSGISSNPLLPQTPYGRGFNPLYLGSLPPSASLINSSGDELLSLNHGSQAGKKDSPSPSPPPKKNSPSPDGGSSTNVTPPPPQPAPPAIFVGSGRSSP